MTSPSRSILCCLVMLSSIGAHASKWEPLWKTENLLNPESVVLDESRNVLFVSLQNYTQDLGGGTIAKLTTNGTVIQRDWIKGLNQPKGILIVGNTLYVTDVTELLEIDMETATIVTRYKLEGMKFLNDIARDEQGHIYVSDMFTSTIYQLKTDKSFSVWMQSSELENPNGLLIKNGTMYIAAWGPFNNDKPLKAPRGRLLAVSLHTKRINRLSRNPLGNLDGIQPMGENFLLSDWIAGGVFEFTPNGRFQSIISTESSAGDIAYLENHDILLIPMAKQGQLLAYRKKK